MSTFASFVAKQDKIKKTAPFSALPHPTPHTPFLSIGGRGGTRTLMHEAHVPKTCVYTNSTTRPRENGFIWAILEPS